jgi:hypothetical protein
MNSNVKMLNPYLAGLELVQKNFGTGGQAALAKCILSLYNRDHHFSIGEVLGPLDGKYTAVVLAMVTAYAKHGETAELRQAGEYVYVNFPRLVELSNAMSDARAGVRQEWARQHEEEMLRQYPNG